MDLLTFNAARCDLCEECIRSCPFQALTMEASGIRVGETCRMCGVCIKCCPQQAIRFEQKAGTVNKKEWRDILIYAEQEECGIHPVAYELIGEAGKLAGRVGYHVNCILLGGPGTTENAEKLLSYGVHNIYVYEHEGLSAFKTDCYTDAFADCIASTKPSVVLIGATALGRSLAPRLSTRFHTGLTADCTQLEMRDDSDLVQIRPAFGGNIMAQILISQSRPQFATVRYKVMDRAEKTPYPTGNIIHCEVTDAMVRSRITVTERSTIRRTKSIEEEEVLVVAGRGVKSDKDLGMLRELAALLGGQLCFTRPMVEAGYGDSTHQIGLSGRTVKPKLIITCGVSGAIQFTSCMNGSECIVAINSDPEAQIFSVANYCIVDDLYEVIPSLTAQIRAGKEA
ncbi:electron transfer flavoprotein subunit alpha [Ruminococcus gauvreauii]|uniref:Electron transfer flavoprotein subunit alpha n=1 Tax=Ruminococcus gauvreauii TaxID=438033 RepID=A0ABY5VKS8_9FIRM|nr:electron transfer flavoprotein subunit alpha [Ruminococcus gauvreauii]UWP60907.1 electron transfer flavoprotein subunit alpha [Ruminococcus gauvreauii]